MASILFLLAFLLTAALAAYRIATRSDQSRITSYLRLGALAIFLLLTITAVLQWSFRWYLLAALLLIWALLAGAALLRKRPDRSGYRPWKSLLRAVGTLILVGLVLIPAIVFPQVSLPPATGPYPVQTAAFTYTDPARTETFSKEGGLREVNVQFWYPADAGGPYPLVVFSHGAFGMKVSNTSTFLNLASHGYVVCSIDHPYHAIFTVNDKRRMTTADPVFMQQIVDLNNGKLDDAAGFPIKKAWIELRSADMNLVLETILAAGSDPASHEVYHLIDPEKIGLMGHSLGGATAAQVTRQRSDIDAVVNLDGDLMGEYLDERNTLNQEPFPAPILSLLTDDITTRLAEIENAEQVVAVKHVTLLSSQGYEVSLPGANHMYMTDLPLISPAMVGVIDSAVNLTSGQADAYATIEKMNGLVLRFFDATLKGQGTFAP